MKKELIIFDLDGTLIDSSGDIAWSANRTLEAFGYVPKGMEDVKAHVGWGVKNLLEKLMPDMPSDRLDEARLKFLEFYGTHLVDETIVYPGVKDAIGLFRKKGKKLAVATNKPYFLAQGILLELDMWKDFNMVIGGDSMPDKKPSPEPIIKILGELGVSPQDAVMVGDSPIDNEAGRAAGISTIGVTYGFRDKNELLLSGFDILIDSIDELQNMIL